MITVLFPNEEEIKSELESQCGDLFYFSRRLLRHWLKADKDTGLAKSTLSSVVLRVVMAMSTKAARQFRSVIELCERGESADASVLARSLFETTLVVGFVLRNRFIPREYNSDGSVRKTIVVPGVRLTREFRATLYVTHGVLKPEVFADRHSKRPGMKRSAKRMLRLGSDTIAGPYKQTIGPDWTKILMKHPRTYSGLSVAGLAGSLGKPFSSWYDTIYGFQSEHVHANDLLHHMQFDEEGTTIPSWHGTMTHVRLTLPTAVAMFYTTIGMINHHVGFGVTMNSALDGFHKEYQLLIDSD